MLMPWLLKTFKERFFWSLLDWKKQNEFQKNSGQIMEWLSGIADIKRWTWLLVLWANDLQEII